MSTQALFNQLAAFAMSMDVQKYRKATQYLSDTLVVKLTARQRPGARERQLSYILTVGRPNYEEQAFLKSCKKAGEPVPVKKTQFKMAKKAPARSRKAKRPRSRK